MSTQQMRAIFGALCFVLLTALQALLATESLATTFTTTVPGTSIVIPTAYPQAGGVVIVLEGANGNVYYQFSNPSSMFVGYQNTGTPAAWRGNPFQIAPTSTITCGIQTCSDYFGGSITRMSVRFTALDGDAKSGDFDFNDLTLRINGFDVGNWSTVPTQTTNTAGTTLIGSGTGFGDNTYDTGWFQSTNAALLSNVMTGQSLTSSVYDRDPNDNYWDFTQGNNLADASLARVAPGVTLDKVANKASFTNLPDTINYTYTIKNIGTVAINSLSVSDNKVPAASITCSPSGGTIAVGATVTCSAVYAVTQADVDAGKVTNIATATGTPQYGSLGPVTDTVTVNGPAAAPSFTFTKSATPATSFGAVGSTITYSFQIKNTGNVTLSNAAISDPSLASLSCTVPAIAPAATATATCTGNSHTVTQADIDAGSLTNAASATAKTPSGTIVGPITSSTTQTAPVETAGIVLTKTASLSPFGLAGTTVSYSFSVKNTGNTTVTPSAVTDAKLAGLTCTPISIAPGATASLACSGTAYTVTQADVDAGQIVNTATATGITKRNTPVSDPDTVTLPGPTRTRSLFLDKTSPTASFNAVGQTISYSYLVRNTGNTSLTTAVTVTDNKATVTCPPLTGGSLAPNATLTCTASYTVTQADIDAGNVVNTATANSGNAQGTVASNSDTVTVPAVQTKSLRITKTPPVITGLSAGQVVTYTYEVTNTGNTSYTTPVTVTDNKIGTFTCYTPTSANPRLDPAEVVSCTGNYTITAADVTAGSVTNTATASSGGTTSPPTSATIPQSGPPSITLDKQAVTTPAMYSAAGQVIRYRYTVVNTGSVTIVNDVTINDDRIGTFTCWTASPGDPEFNVAQTITCERDYTVTAADVGAGVTGVTNNATATAVAPGNVTVTANDSITVPRVNPGLDVTKSASPATATSAGQTITYTLSAHNTGDVALTSVKLTDPLIPSLACTIATLPAGSTNTSCTGIYTVTQADVDAGVINNTATGTALTPMGTAISDTGTLSTPVTQTTQRSLNKSNTANADEDGSATISLNDTLTYKVVMSNTGNTTQTNVVVTDPQLAPSSQTCAAVAPGAQCVLTGTYKITQSNVDGGQFINTASVTSTQLPTATTASATVTIPRSSSIAISKALSTGAPSPVVLGSVLPYTVKVTNSGNVSQANVVVSDPLLTPSSTTCATLAPGATCTLSGTHTVTQADVNAGQVANTASATTTLLPTPKMASLITPIVRNTSLAIIKPAPALTNNDANPAASLGDTLTYTITVTNDGNVTQSNVVVADNNITPASNTCATLQPGQTCVLTGTHTITQADVDLGTVANTAGVTSTLITTPRTASNAVPVPQTRSLSVDKSSPTADFSAVGDVISYSYLVRNTGNVTIARPVTISDNKIASVSCPALPPGGLAPNATLTCTATYTVTQADLDAGSVVNTATANTTAPNGSAVASAPDQVTVPAAQTPALTIDKTSTDTSFASVGTLLSYSYTVRNSGNVTFTNAITVTDNKIAQPATAPNEFSCAYPAGSFAPGATFTCTAKYAVTQADIDAGGVTNTATVSSTFGATPVTGTDAVTIPAIKSPKLSVAKTPSPSPYPAANFLPGNTVSYTYVVKNEGNTTLNGPLSLSDNRIVSPNSISCPVANPVSLAPGASVTCTATYTFVLADTQLGSVTNNALASIGPIVSPSVSVTIPSNANPAISLTKSTTATSLPAVGQTIPYTYTVTNTGNAVFANPIVISDNKFPTAFTCWTTSVADPVLAPTEQATCTADYTVTQADLDNGFVTNEASAQTTYAGVPVVSPPATKTVAATQNPSLTVTKSAATLPLAAAGQVLTYTITAENTGNVTLSNVSVSDPMLPGLSCSPAPPATLDAASPSVTAGKITCTGTHTVTQAEFDSGSLSNTASASGLTPQGAPVNGQATSNITADPATPAMTISKTADVTDFQAVGETITYTFVIHNTGNVTLTSAGVNDPLLTPAAVCNGITLAPNQSRTCTGTYTVKQSDIDNGSIANTATASATPSRGTLAPVAPASETVNGPTRVAGVTLNKIADTASFDTVGQVLSYTYVVANTGNVTLTVPVAVSDDKIPSAGINCPWPPSGLPPNSDIECTASYIVTQADLDAGQVTNKATAASGSSTQPTTSPQVQATVPAVQNKALAIAKTASSGPFALGSQITYTVTVANTGNVTQHNVVVTDPKLTPTQKTCASVAPGGSCVLSGTYTVIQADVDAGTVSNTASTTSDEVPAAQTSTVNTPIAQTSSIALRKEPGVLQDANGNGRADAGEVLTYKLIVTNSGTTTLSQVTVSDPKATVSGGPLASLAPGASDAATFTAQYTLTQTDIDAGNVDNQASVAANKPGGGAVSDVSDPASDTGNGVTPTPLAKAPALTLDKTAGTIVDANGSGRQDAGDTITYSYVVTNSGNTTITSAITIADDKIAPANLSCPAAASIAPGDTVTCSGTYTLTQADVNAGSITNNATASDGTTTSPSVSATALITKAPALTIVKTPPAIVTLVVGPITYSFEVTNSGNTSVALPISVNDNLIGTFTCGAASGSIDPGAKVTCTAVYNVTHDDVNLGVVTNTASASAAGVPASPTVSATVPAGSTPALTIDKTSPTANFTAVGDVITYTFKVTNTGTRAFVNPIVVKDPNLAADLTCWTETAADTEFAPGETVECSGTYAAKQTDIDQGYAENTATAQTTYGSGPTTVSSAPDTVQVPAVQTPVLEVTKSVATLPVTTLGQTLTYTITVANTGNVKVNNITVTDPLIPTLSCSGISVAAGASDSSCNGTYTVTQDDLNAGKIVNTAKAAGQTPTGTAVEDTGTLDTPVTQSPAISVLKLAPTYADTDGSGTVTPGDVYTYAFTVKNEGNVQLTNINIVDDRPDVTVVGGPVALDPGQSDTTSFTATHAVTQTEIDAGSFDNRATVSGTSPLNVSVSDISDPATAAGSGQTTTTIAAAPVMALVKTAGNVVDTDGNGTDAGDTITYLFELTNTGNVTLNTLSISDTKLLPSPICSIASLAPGASTTCTSNPYAITQAEVDAGEVQNSATATGSPPSGAPINDVSDSGAGNGSSPTVKALSPTASVAVTKAAGTPTVDKGANASATDAGDTISYTFVVTNTGARTVQGVTVTDAKLSNIVCTPTTLVPQATANCTADPYVLTQTDINAAAVTNTAKVTATPVPNTADPNPAPVTDISGATNADDAQTVTPIATAPSIALIKEAGAPSVDKGTDATATDAGDTIAYTFTLTNTGTVTLNSLSVSDAKVGAVACAAPSLEPGTSTTCTALYTITLDDMNAGAVTNSATASGTPPATAANPNPAPVTDVSGSSNANDAPTVTPLATKPGLTLVKTAGTPTTKLGANAALTDADDTVTYTFEVTNTGTVTLSDIAINDPKIANVTCSAASLAPGATTTCTGVYTLTQADVDTGSVSNSATVAGTPPATAANPNPLPVTDVSGSAADNNTPTTTTLPRTPALALAKKMTSYDDKDGNGFISAGDVLTYVVTATNTGTVSLPDVTVADNKVTPKSTTCVTVAPRAICFLTGTYTVTAADMTAGEIINKASATTPALAAVIAAKNTVNVFAPVSPTQFTKVAVKSDIRRGERVPFVIEMVGVPLNPARIVDIMPPGFAYVPGSGAANGVPVEPTINGRNLTFDNLVPDGKNSIKLQLTLISTAAVATGDSFNNAQLINPETGVQLASARAKVTIIPEHVFDCGEIIGKVFDDQNRNGYQDEGEPGLPGVRVVTVKGLLITSDKFGRFHVACADIPDQDIGSNFIMKLDTRTLPTGYRVTTENPRTVRLTRGKITKLNFGAAISKVVKLDLNGRVFNAGSNDLKDKWLAGIDQLVAALDGDPATLRITYFLSGEDRGTANARIDAVANLVRQRWARKLGRYKLPIETRIVGDGGAQ